MARNKKKRGVAFTSDDVLGNKVECSKEVYHYHVLRVHPGYPAGGIAQRAITEPVFVDKDRFGAHRFYVKLTPEEREGLGTQDRYLIVICSLRGGGWKIDSFYNVPGQKPGGKIIWQR